MSFMLTRMFAYLTLVAYLAVGSVCVRVLMPEMTTLEFSTAYTKIFSNSTLNESQELTVTAPEMMFAEIKIEEKKTVPVKVVAKVATVKTAPVKMTVPKLAKHELNFSEPVVLKAINTVDMLPTMFAANFVPFQYNEQAVDEVTTKLAATEEPEFFSYEAEPKEIQKNQIEEKVEVAEVSSNVAEEVAVEELVAFDYSVPEAPKATAKVAEPTTEKIEQNILSSVTTQKVLPTVAEVAPLPVDDFKNFKVREEVKPKEEVQHGFVSAVSAPTYPNELTIQVTGTDFKRTNKEHGFEIRFQDDLNESVQDYNGGYITMNSQLAEKKMTRSLTLLKQGFAPTNADIILEAGRSEVTLPLIEESTFKDMILPFEKHGPMGAVLVELGDEVESLDLDVPYGKVITLNEKMQITTGNDYLYQVFVGVKAGNALLSYKTGNGDIVSKIIHVHEQEVTFESYFAEDVKKEKVELFEEGLLGREKIALGISSNSVVQFATNQTAQKLTANKFKTNFKKNLLGSRRYLELGHQEEPIFVGFRENTKLDIPSENFMRLILSKFEGSGLGNRCLIQVNLSKKVVKVDVGAESVEASVMTYVQMLDTDGQFYDSAGEKTTKVIVVGESQGAPEISKDSKINFKLMYEDGSEQFLSSYCSPNSYLVEQL